MKKRYYQFTHPSAHPVHSHRMLELLGVKSLPVDGLPERTLAGIDIAGQPVEIRVWVVPLVGERKTGAFGRVLKRSAHRVRCACPGCGAELSAGRLFQHVCNRRQKPLTTAEAYDARVAGTLEL
jgi:hypothetical protein